MNPRRNSDSDNFGLACASGRASESKLMIGSNDTHAHAHKRAHSFGRLLWSGAQSQSRSHWAADPLARKCPLACDNSCKEFNLVRTSASDCYSQHKPNSQLLRATRKSKAQPKVSRKITNPLERSTELARGLRAERIALFASATETMRSSERAHK